MIHAQRILTLFIGLACLSLTAAAGEWVEYRPQGVGFSIEMPGKWLADVQDAKSEFGDVKSYSARVDLGTRVYIAGYSRYPDKFRGKPLTSMSMLNGARDRAVKTFNGNLRTEERIVIGALPVRHLIMDDPDGAVFVFRFVARGTTLIHVAVAGPRNIENETDTRQFLDSLKITLE